ncbi:MAG: PAS domain-containing protein [Candidatus Aureabacteria bacterium]|nr:PAS domain-containing protein [Candidatus Auribacterota bacterium]
MDNKVEELKKHIKILSESRNLYQTIMNSLQDGILVINKNQEILFYNSSFIKHLNIKSKSASMTIKDLYNHLMFKNILMETKEMDFVHYVRDVEIFSPQKKYLSVQAICLDGKDSEKSVIYIVHDTTVTKHKQEEAFNKEKIGAVLTLGAGIAHELGNPLNSLSIHLQIIKKSLKGNKKSEVKLSNLKKQLDIIEDETKRMDHVISSFLKAIRPEKVLYKEIDIIRTVKNAVDSVVKVAEKHGVNILFNTEIEKKYLFADAQKIHQALINIILNAIEAIKSKGNITISCDEQAGFIIIRITDDGPGIDEEKISQIFDPFFTTKDTGVGLGLVISYRIIREHDGEISVKSSPGKGATFQIKLPLREYKMKFLESKVNKRN